MFPLAPPLLRSFSWNPAPIIIKLPAHEDSPAAPDDLGIRTRRHRWRTQDYDISTDWPFTDLAQLQAAGAMKWTIPREFGGDQLSPLDLHLRYEQLAKSSVATAMILAQRDAAVGLIDAARDCLRTNECSTALQKMKSGRRSESLN